MPSLKRYSTFGLDADCASIHAFSDISSFLSLYNSHETVYLLGGGSNSIFTEDFQGAVLVNEIKGISHFDDESYHYLRVGAGENWHDFVTLCLENQWYGLENLALIPGSVGASPIQNIGAYGIEVNAFIETLLKNDDCAFGYRDSIFKNTLANKVLITHVNFKLPKAHTLVTSYGELAALEKPTPESIYHKVIEIRQQKLPDPSSLGNAGSFFKNPVVPKWVLTNISKQYDTVPHFPVPSSDVQSNDEFVKIPAAWLIDQAGFKGATLNQVRCHPTQPLVLTNMGAAKGSDVIAMANDIITTVHKKFAIKLEPEVRLLGSKGLISL